VFVPCLTLAIEAKKNCQIPTCLTTGAGFISTKLFCSQARRCAPARTVQALALTVLLKSLSFVSVADIILLHLSEFHVDRVNIIAFTA